MPKRMLAWFKVSDIVMLIAEQLAQVSFWCAERAIKDVDWVTISRALRRIDEAR